MDNEQAITIQRWISLANNDIRTARKALDDPDPITNTACLHTQQCAEKALKAVLASQGQHIGKMHDLEILLEKCLLKDPEFEVLRKDVSPLNPYSVTPRYVDDWREIPLEEAEEALANARKVFDFVKEKLEKYL